MEFGDAMGTLASEDYVTDVALVMGGFAAPAVVKYGVEDKMGRDLPDEAYGATVAAGGALYGGHGRKVAIGGGVHVLEALRTWFMDGN
jgi:hypothetical protein